MITKTVVSQPDHFFLLATVKEKSGLGCETTKPVPELFFILDYSIDLFVTNVNFDTLLMGDVLVNFSIIMRSLLQSEELLVEDVVHPTFRGDSLPLPTGERQYKG